MKRSLDITFLTAPNPQAEDGQAPPVQTQPASTSALNRAAIESADHLFVQVANLSTLWSDRQGFTVVDTHFDAGACFLATWSAWRSDPQASERLHYVAFDPDATTAETLAARWHPFLQYVPEAGPSAGVNPEKVIPTDPVSKAERCHIEQLRELIGAWPEIVVKGIRTLEMAAGSVILTIAVGDAVTLAANMRLRGDAFFLHGESLRDEPFGITGKGDRRAGRLSQMCKALARMAAVGAPIVASIGHLQNAARGPEQSSVQSSERARAVAYRTDAERALCDAITAASFVLRKNGAPQSGAPSKSLDANASSALNTLIGHFAPRWRVRKHPPPPAFIKVPSTVPNENSNKSGTEAAADPNAELANKASSASDRTALVIGAGLAGCHVVERLTAKGWKVTLIDQADQPASGASGNPAGVFHPMITADEGLAARLSRSGFVHALSRWQALERAGHTLRWRQTGLIQLGLQRQDDWDGEIASTTATAQATPTVAAQPPGLPKSMVEDIDSLTASRLIGISDAVYPPASWLFKQGGWIDPVSLCHALLAASKDRLTCRFGQTVDSLDQHDDVWRALDSHGDPIATARIVIIANAYDAQRLAQLNHVNMDNIRGQLTFLPADLLPGLARPAMGSGYLTPTPDGPITGASYGVGDTRTEIDPKDHADNLDRLASLLGLAGAVDTDIKGIQPSSMGPDGIRNAAATGAAAENRRFGLNIATLRGRVAFRCTSRDRLPMIGLLGDEQLTAHRAGSLTGAQAVDLPRRAGLYAAFGYGSRGLIWSALGAELLLSQIEHTPPPLESDLIDAVDPARFLLRDVRRGKVR